MSMLLVGLVLYFGGKALLQIPGMKRPSSMELYRAGKLVVHDGKLVEYYDPD